MTGEFFFFQSVSSLGGNHSSCLDCDKRGICIVASKIRQAKTHNCMVSTSINTHRAII